MRRLQWLGLGVTLLVSAPALARGGIRFDPSKGFSTENVVFVLLMGLFGALALRKVMSGGVGLEADSLRDLPRPTEPEQDPTPDSPLLAPPRRFGAYSPRRRLEDLRQGDPAFSVILFEDFLASLYAKALEARGSGTLDQLSGYLRPAAREVLAGGTQNLKEVRDVIVGGLVVMSVEGIDEPADRVHVTVRFQSNYTELLVDGDKRVFWVVEAWRLSRMRDTKSKPPERLRALACPNCGAPLDGVRGGECRHCRRKVDTGEFDWCVESLELVEKTFSIPSLMGLDGAEAEEQPTFQDADAQARLGALDRRDPKFNWEGFSSRAELIFLHLQRAWSALDWRLARPYVTESLYQSQSYWIEVIRSRGRRTSDQQPRVLRLELARVVDDDYHDAITVRVFAQGHSHVVDYPTGNLTFSSGVIERVYSEYWTLIRSRSGALKVDGAKHCPNCGGPVNLTTGGDCPYCRAHLLAGDFDWVLSRIEQPEAYR